MLEIQYQNEIQQPRFKKKKREESPTLHTAHDE
jgi:hypothetical protein